MKSIKITKPSEMTSGFSKLEESITKFEKELLTEDKDETYFHLVIVGEYNRVVCDEVERIYTEVGWKNVKCKTSSENGERPGLTGLILYK